jgi:3-hydroxyisobutyrate dehydrogenase
VSDAVSTVGFVGLGNMGGPMTGRLVAAGMRVQAFDLSADARAAAVALGATDAPDLATAVAGADAVILMLPNSAIVAGVLADPALVAVMAPGTLVVDMSSSEPMKTRELAEQLAARGIHMVDAPVSGGVGGAKAGTLTIMAGGSDADIERVRPVLEALGTPVHTGAVGSGHAIKALNNLLSATHLWATSEAMIAGAKFGLDPEVMLAVFNGSSGRSGSTQNKWPNFILPGTYDSGFGLRLMLKDMKIAVQLADQAGVPISLGADAVALWQRAADDLPPTADHTRVAQWLAEQPD